MDFVASMTHRAPELRKILQLWRSSGDLRNPFSRTIYTPLFAEAGVQNLMAEEFSQVGGVIFDSGGYFVQQGVTTVEALYKNLMRFYESNDWGSHYVLLDYVPHSQLTPAEVVERVEATMSIARLFHAEMPKHLQERALPVVQGYTREQVEACVEVYADLGVKTIGFGSFATSGDNNNINMVTAQSLELVDFVKEKAARYGLKLHLFGIGTPEVLSHFKQMEIDSFDSSCWSRTAGYGNVYLPFKGRRNLSAKMIREVGGAAYRAEEFIRLRDETGHDCPFCRDYEVLKTNRVYRMVHNLCVIMDTVGFLNQGETAVTLELGLKPSRYSKMEIPKTYLSSK